MEWWLVLLIIIGSVMAMIMTKLPVAFAFLLFNLFGAYFVFGGTAGLNQVAISMSTSVASFTFLALPLFVFLGEVVYHSGLGTSVIDALGSWLGKVPGRLSILTIGTSTMFGALSGSGLATTAMMGTVMVPEMTRRGYHKSMIIGPIVGSGGLAMIIPPSGMAILLGALAQISISKLLIAGIVPGVLIGVLYILYVTIRCTLNPSLAPAYEVAHTPFTDKMKLFVRDVVPMSAIFVAAIGLIFLGITTPTEAAAAGALTSLLLAAVYGKLNVDVLKKAIFGTVRVTAMLLLIISASTAFTQIMNFTGATSSFVEVVTKPGLAPILIILGMQAIVLLLGCFIDQMSILMIAIPLFMPIVKAIGFDPIAFGLLMLLCIEMGNITPPFGLGLFVMGSVTPPEITMADIFRAAIPFVLVELLAVGLITFFPSIATFLPNVMSTIGK